MKPEVDPSYVLRSYVWAVLEANDPQTWNKANYGNLIPIVPVGEEPELSEFSGPNIVFVPNHEPSVGPRGRGVTTFVLSDPSIRRIAKTVNILLTALDREDETARDINNFSSRQSHFLGMRFGYVKLSYAEGALPEEAEGGRNYAVLVIEYEYYVDYTVITAV